jgi:hypothetical protein
MQPSGRGDLDGHTSKERATRFSIGVWLVALSGVLIAISLLLDSGWLPALLRLSAVAVSCLGAWKVLKWNGSAGK